MPKGPAVHKLSTSLRMTYVHANILIYRGRRGTTVMRIGDPPAQMNSTVPSSATTYTSILSIVRTSRLTRSAALRAEAGTTSA